MHSVKILTGNSWRVILFSEILQAKPEEDEGFIEECQNQYEKYLQLETKLLQELGILEEEKADVWISFQIFLYFALIFIIAVIFFFNDFLNKF